MSIVLPAELFVTLPPSVTVVEMLARFSDSPAGNVSVKRRSKALVTLAANRWRK